MAYVSAPDGTPFQVPDEQLQLALSRGFKVRQPSETEKAKAAAGEQPGRAFVEGVARGASFGLADPVMVGLGVKRAELKARREENPVAATVGEMTGAVGTSALTGGGVSALAGGGMRGALVEGGLYGLGSVIGEGSLENRPVTIDRMASGFVGGALGAGTVHGGLELLKKGASLTMSKFGGGTLQETLRNAADQAEMRALFKGNLAGARNIEDVPAFLKFAREHGISGIGSSLDEATLKKASDLSAGYAEKIRAGMSKLEEHVPLSNNAGLRNEMADYLEQRLSSFDSSAGASPAYDDAMKTASKYVNSLRKTNRSWQQAWDVQSSLFKEVVPDSATGEVREALRKGMRDFVFNEVASGRNKAGSVLSAFEPAGRLQSQLPPAVAKAVTVDLSEPTGAAGVFEQATAPTVIEGASQPLAGTQLLSPDVSQVPLGRDVPSALGRTRSTVSVEGGVEHPGGIFSFPSPSQRFASGAPTVDEFKLPAPEFEPHTVSLGADASVPGGLEIPLPAKQTPAWFGAELRQTGREARMAMALEDALQKRIEKLDLSGTSLAQLGTGLAVGFKTGSPVMGLASAVLEKQIERRGGLMAGAVLRRMADSTVLNAVAKGLQQRVGTILSSAPEMLGAFRAPISRAAALGADALLQEHLRLAAGPYGQDYLSRLGMPVESENEVAATGHKIAILDALHESGQSEDREIDGLFGSAPGRKGGVGVSMTLKEFEGVKSKIEGILADPSRAFEKMPPELRAAAPAATTEALGSTLRAMQFLNSKMPKDPYAGMPASVRPEWQPDAVSLDRFARYKEAVESPARVLKNMANGYISPEQVEALQAVYPALYADLQQRIGERLAMWQKPLTYQQKLAMGALLGPQAFGMTPQQVQVLQQVQTGARGAGAMGPEGATNGPDGRQDVNEEQIQTESQKLESR